jgi:hypothetical protein
MFQWVKIVLPFTLLILIIGAFSLEYKARTALRVTKGYSKFVGLIVDFLRPGISLGLLRHNILVTDVPLTYGERMAVRTKRGFSVVPDLQHLKNFVLITTPAQALMFVRLRTSWQTYMTMSNPFEVEMESETQHQTMPSFGLPNSQEFSGGGGAPIDPVVPNRVLLSDRAFRDGGLTPPIVTRSGANFQVVRWIYQINPGNKHSICEVRELVGRDGTYSQFIIKHRNVSNS